MGRASSVEEDMDEVQCLSAQREISSPLIEFMRFSKWERALRTMTYVKRFISRPRLLGILTMEEMQWAELQLIKQIQNDAFREEVYTLQDNCGKIGKKSPLKRLSPFLDSTGIVRLRGRLENAKVIQDHQKNPIILPKHHYGVQLLINWYHRKFKQCHHEIVINEIFKRYHIIGLRNMLRHIRASCQVCKNNSAKPEPPEMGILPTERMSPFTRPFSYVGVDFFGPLLVTVGRRSEKRYGVVFTCLTCRAVHLETAYSLSMNFCIMAVRNFIARRGTPIRFFSDNGTNLRAAEKELREAHQKLQFETLQAEFTTTTTDWQFLPPASPHMGGAWELMVRTIKTVLYRIVKPNIKLADEKLHNFFAEVENIINSRPLTYLSLETSNHETLTPNHFLLGSSSGSKPPGKFDVRDEYVRQSWRQIQMLADKFWRRWVSEIMPTLIRRVKWHDKGEPILPGDVVIIVDENFPRCCWSKSIAVDVCKGKDGQVRSAYVKMASGTHHRPETKIAVLEVRDRPKKS